MLTQLVYRSVKWTSFSALIKAIVYFTQTAVLARILNREEFGQAALVMIVVSFGQMYADAGMTNAIISYKNVTNNQLNSLFWFNMIVAIILTMFIMIISPFVSTYYNDINLQYLVNYGSIVILFYAPGVLFQSLLQKELRFNHIAIINIVSVIGGGSSTIIIALLNGGAFSIVIGFIIVAFLKTMLSILYGRNLFKLSFHFSISEIKKYLSFGFYQLGEKTVGFIATKIDQFLISIYFGLEVLGVYSIAFNLVMLPIQGINPIITRIAFPVFVKIVNDNSRIIRGYTKMLKILMLINGPILIVLAAVASSFVQIFYGAHWSEAILLIQILAFAALFCSYSNPIGSIILAKKKADLSFKWNVFVAISSLFIIMIGSTFGINGVAISLVGLSIVFLIIEYYYLLVPLVGRFGRQYFIKSLIQPLSYSLCAGFGAFIISSLILHNQIVKLIVGVACGSSIFLCLVIIFEKEFLMENLLMLKKESKRY